MTVTVAHDAAQSAAVHAAPGDALAIVGPAGSGKTTALVARAERLADTLASDAGRVFALAPSDAGVHRLRSAFGDARSTVVCRTFGDLAFEILGDDAPAGSGVACIDDVRASLHFEHAGAELFALSWTEFADEVDPEITGLRTPERFSAAAFRLIRKLRASMISPEEFRRTALRGANEFYAKPPNFADAALIADTSAKYRDSLRASPAELDRQHRREIDLVKILARLYASYVDTLVAAGCMTPTDAVYEAAERLRARPALRERARARIAAAVVDDAQDLVAGHVALLEALFGAGLGGVTLAGDAAQATCGFATGARGADIFRRASLTTIALEGRYRSAPGIAWVARRALDPATAPARPPAPDDVAAVSLYRADSVRDEARYVATEIAALVRAGTPPPEIAVIVRGLGCARTYVDALLARGVPTDIAGSAGIFEEPVVLDALAALWSAVDPYRHEYLLRVLEAPWMRLTDASVAVLCADAAEPQPLLFDVPDDGAEPGERRWDRKRNLRLGRNVTRGDVDADLPAEARERLVAFRAARARWEAAARSLGPAELARLVLDESVLATLASGVRGRYDAHLVARLLDEIDAFAAREPLATLEDFLAYAERIASAEADLLVTRPHDPDAVRVLDVEAAKGETFDAVFVVGARAGAWPRYYVPDAFLFTPTLGMIPKENVGDADAARTAKFTYALYRAKLRDKYVAEERRALSCAASRARRTLSISASGRATKGVAAPEILTELQRAF
jgi:superfamily I DNA/RNA helicase